MKNKMKKLIALILMTAFVQGYIDSCFAFTLTKVNNSKTVAETKVDNAIAQANEALKISKAQKAEKNVSSKNVKLISSKVEKKQKKSDIKTQVVKTNEEKVVKNDTTKVKNIKQKPLKVKNTKKQTSSTNQGFWAKYKAKRQAKKDAEITVTAKTDSNQPSVLIQTQNNKNIKKESVQKKSAKAVVDNKTQDVELKEQVLDKQDNSQSENVFDAPKSMAASVSTTEIISVDDCVKIALQNNPAIVSQMMNKDIYKNKVAQAWSNYFPTLTAGVSYSRNDMMVTNFAFPMQKYNLWNTPQLGFNQLIYDFGKTGAQAGVAKKTFEAAQENLQASINDIVYQVKSAYYNLLFLQQQVEVYEDSVLQYQIHLKQAEAYYDIGSKAKIDVSTAKYNLDNTKLTLITAKNAVDDGFAKLTNAMGTPEIPDFSIKDRLDKKRYDVKFEDVLKIAYESRPELMAAKKKMEGSKLLVKSSKVAFLPDIRGYGTYTNGGKKVDMDYGYQIGAQLAYSNVNLFLMKKQVDEANMTYKKDQADYEVQRQKVYLDVKQAFIQLRNSQQSIPVARSSMQVAQERYDLAAGRYKVGLGDAIELKDAQNELMEARLQYYNTLMQYHISAANVERVMGAPLSATEENL